jgi:hypothetical protein
MKSKWAAGRRVRASIRAVESRAENLQWRRWRAVWRRGSIEARRRTGTGQGIEDEAAGEAPGSGRADRGRRRRRPGAATPRSGRQRPAGEGGIQPGSSTGAGALRSIAR